MPITMRILLVAAVVCFGHPQATNARKPEPPATPRTARISKLPGDAALLQISATGPAAEKLQEFQVLAGTNAGSTAAEFEKRTGRTVVNWQPHTLRMAKGGRYDWPLARAYDVTYLRLEAEGYQPQIAGPIKKADGPQRIEFRLETERYVGGRVLTPDRQPAAGATVALALAQKDAVLENGRLRGANEPPPDKPSDRWRRPLVVKTDDEGRFKLPTEPSPAAVLVLHDSGVKEIAYDLLRKSPEVILDGWGRIEGRMLWKDAPSAEEEVTLSVHRDDYGYPGMIASYATTRTDKEGRFTFERALPGQTQISRPLRPVQKPAADGVTSIILPTQSIHANVKAGEATRILLGGQGRLVRGKLTGRDSWKDVTFHFHPTAPHIGFPSDDAMWQAFGELQKSPIGPLLFRNKQAVNADGTFEVADMLPGDYQLFVSVPGVQNYAAYVSVSVDPEVPAEKPAALDLGEIQVKSP